MMKARLHSGAGASFTLVEILTATAVLSVLFTIMFAILQQTSKGWQAANRRVEASQVARLALDQIASDLENCITVAAANVPVPGSPQGANYGFGFIHANRPSFRTDILATASLPANVNISEPNDYIFVVTPYLPSLTMGTGDLCEVGYVPVYVARSIGYGNTRGGRYILLRHMPLSFSTNSTIDSAQPVHDFLADSAGWFLTPPLSDSIQTGPVARNFFPIVDNLIAFNVEFVYANSSGVLTNSTSWGRPTNNGTWAQKPAGAPDGLPLAADITLSIFDEKAAERIQRIPGRGLSRALDSREKEAVSQTPVPWTNIPTDIRSTLQESVLTLKRRVFFKNAQR